MGIVLKMKTTIEKRGSWIIETYKSFLSTPWWAYSSLIIVIIFLAIFYKNGFHIHFSENLMYGMAGSLVVSILIDLGTTQRNKKANMSQYNMLIARLKRQCISLPDCALSTLREWDLTIDEKLLADENDFKKMESTIPIITTIISKHEKHGAYEDNFTIEAYKMYVDIIVQCIESITKEATFVYDVARRSEQNDYINSELIDKVKRLMDTGKRYQTIVKMLLEYAQSEDYNEIIRMAFISLQYDDDAEAFYQAIHNLFPENETT